MDLVSKFWHKLMKGGSSVLAVVLSITMVTSMVPVSSVAYAADPDDAAIVANAPPAEDTQQPTLNLGEVNENDGENNSLDLGPNESDVNDNVLDLGSVVLDEENADENDDIDAQSEEEGDEDTPKAIENNEIAKNGTYLLGTMKDANVVIAEGVTDVKIVGESVLWNGTTAHIRGAANTNVTFDATRAPGITMEFEGVYLSNNGTKNTIDLAGADNKIVFSGCNIIDHNGNAVYTAAIHVGPTTEVTIGGSGVAYLYKHEQGAGIGGAKAGELNGKITFDMPGGMFFGKGSKQGAFIGAAADASKSGTPGDIEFIAGTYNLVAYARGAAIGGSAGGQGGSVAGTITVRDNVNMSVWTAFTGAAIGGGGHETGNDKPGGLLRAGGASIRTYATANSVSGTSHTSGKPVEVLWSKGVSADCVNTAKQTLSGEAAAYLRFDANLLSSFDPYNYEVLLDGESFYNGPLHQYMYIDEDAVNDNDPDADETVQSTATPSNWIRNYNDSSLYFYVTPETHSLTVNGEEFIAQWNDTTQTFNVVDAASVTPDEQWDVSQSGDGSVIATLYQNGRLAFEGNGALKTLTSKTIPWKDVKDQIKTVEFCEGVTATSIANYFINCTALTEIIGSLPAGLTKMGSAFKGCTSLTKIAMLPEGVVDISSAFSGCTSLVTLPSGFSIPSSVQTISDAFYVEADEPLTTYCDEADFEALTHVENPEMEFDWETDFNRYLRPYLKDISNYLVSVENIAYTGAALDPQAIVRENVEVNPLVQGTDYAVRIYADEKCTEEVRPLIESGTYYLRAEGIGDYAGMTKAARFVVTNTYTLFTAEDLADFSDRVNAGEDFSGDTVYLGADIDLRDLPAGRTFAPIGSANTAWGKHEAGFVGTFDGQGHKITLPGVFDSQWNVDHGLFGALGTYGVGNAKGQNAIVRNLLIDGSVSSGYRTGALAGVAYNATITNVGTTAGVYGTFSQAYVGGLIGSIEGAVNAGNAVTISNCFNQGDVQGASNSYVGGLVGYVIGTKLTMQNCYNTGDVALTAGSYAGGLIARISGLGADDKGSITKCYNAGNVEVTSTSTGGNPIGYEFTTTDKVSLSGIYYAKESSPNSFADGTAKTAESMKEASFVTALGAQFALDEHGLNDGYPLLAWQLDGFDPAAPVITSQSNASHYIYGTASMFNLQVTAEAPAGSDASALQYQWYVALTPNMSGRAAIDGATTEKYLPSVDQFGAAYYQCDVACDGVVTSSRPIPVVVHAAAVAPSITAQPQDIEALPGEQDHIISVEVEEPAVGSTYAYQWYVSSTGSKADAAAISGATDAEYAVPTNEEGTFYYFCRITNAFEIPYNTATVDSEWATVTVKAPEDERVLIESWEFGSPVASAVVASLYSNGDFVISGAGATIDTSTRGNYLDVPWRTQYESIKRVYFEDGVLPPSMSYWFQGATNLTEFNGTIPTSVKSMACTFSGTALEKAPNIPSGVTTLTSAFMSSKITEAPLLPSSCTSLSDTFRNCTNLTILPVGFSFPSKVSSSLLKSAFTLSTTTDKTITWCAPSDYDALTKAYDWAAANRVLRPYVGNVGLASQTNELGVVQGDEGASIGVKAVAIRDTDNAAITYKWLSSGSSDMAGASEIVGATDADLSIDTSVVGIVYYQCEASLDGSTIASDPIPVQTYAAVDEPSITKQPTDASAQLGMTAPSFQVEAECATEGATLSYQWYMAKSGSYAQAQMVAGATSATYTPAASAPGDAYYFCRVTATKGIDANAKSVDSNVVALTVVGEADIVIETADQWLDFAQKVNGTYVDPETGETAFPDPMLGKVVLLANDIDMSTLSEGRVIEPVGDYKNGVTGADGKVTYPYFAGSFNGQGHKVTNVVFKPSASKYYQSLFGCVRKTPANASPLAISAVAKYQNPILENVVVEGSFYSTSYRCDYIGGLVGEARDAVIRNCGASVDIVDYNAGHVGGLIGSLGSGSYVYGCYATGNVTDTGTSANSAACLIGEASCLNVTNRDGVVADCYATGTFTGPSYTTRYATFGSLIGTTQYTTFNLVNCYALGSSYSLVGQMGSTYSGTAYNATANIVNCFDSTGRAQTVYSSYPNITINGAPQAITAAELGEQAIIDQMNAGRADVMWVADATGINNGMPVLAWQAENAPLAFPIIVSNPEDVQVELGAKTQLELSAIVADGSDASALSYQWYVADNASMEGRQAVRGANSATYAFNPDAEGDSYYQCDVTLGSSTMKSKAAKVTVTANTAEEVVISTADDLADFAAMVNGTYEEGVEADAFRGRTVRLANDIDLASLSDGKTFAPIGANETTPFMGTFDGEGHSIKGLDVDTGRNVINGIIGNYAGLFGCVQGTQNLHAQIANVIVYGTAVAGNHAGLVAGYADWTEFQNCGAEGTVYTYGYNAGGMVGWASSCYATGCYANVNVKGHLRVGGLAGIWHACYLMNEVSMSDCYALGTVASLDETGVEATGGLVGTLGPCIWTSLQDCYTAVSGAKYAIFGNEGTPQYIGLTNVYFSPDVSGAATAFNADDPRILAVTGAADENSLPTCSSRTAEEMLTADFVASLNGERVEADAVWVVAATADGQATYPQLAWQQAEPVVEPEPVITTQPEATEVELGNETTLSVAAKASDDSDAEISYQWYVAAGEDMVDRVAVEGATAAMWTYAPAGLGEFWTQVDVTIGDFTVSSDAVKVTVSEPAPTEIDSEGDFVITKNGTYYLSRTFNNKAIIIEAGVTDVKLIGYEGASNPNVLINANKTSGLHLTLQDLTIMNNSISRDDAHGSIDFGTGENTLTIEGSVRLDHEYDAVYTAGIHVAPGTQLTINGSGEMYLYKKEQGAGIGGALEGEINGTIIFDMDGTFFAKGTKQGATIGSANNAVQPAGDIIFKKGSVNVIAMSRGAAIGGAAGSKGSKAGNVYVYPNANVNVWTNYTGATIGSGGGNDTNDVIGGTLYVYGGSIRTYASQNSTEGIDDTSGAQVNVPWHSGVGPESIRTENIFGNDRQTLYYCVVDAGDGLKDTGNEIYVDGELYYEGPSHAYAWVDEEREANPDAVGSIAGNNFTTRAVPDTNFYLYLAPYDQFVTVNGKEFKALWDASTNTFTVVDAATVQPVETWDVSKAQDGSIFATIYKSGRLAFEGKGVLRSYGKEKAPWFVTEGIPSVTSVEFCDGLTGNLCDYFNGCTELVTVSGSMPVAEETSAMFKNCVSLTTIPVIPLEDLAYAEEMFSGCTSLTELPVGFVLPDADEVELGEMFYVDSDEPLVTYCADEDYEALSAYDWASDNRRLVRDISSYAIEASDADCTSGSVTPQLTVRKSADSEPLKAGVDYVAKIYADEACTQELSSVSDFGTYWVVAEGVGSYAGTTAAASWSVYGEVLIHSAVELADYADRVNAGEDTRFADVKLCADIDLNDLPEGRLYNPIASFNKQYNRTDAGFLGKFDGQGHKVTMAKTVSNTDADSGLFGALGSVDGDVAHVSNLVIDGQVYQRQRTGALAGVAINAVITNVGSDATFVPVSGYGITPSYVGGLVGAAYGYYQKDCNVMFDKCYSRGTWKSTASSAYIGGFIGYTANANVSITNSFCSANVEGTNGAALVGGFIGHVSITDPTNIENVYFAGKVTRSSSASKVVFGNTAGSTVTVNSLYCLDDGNSVIPENGIAKSADEMKGEDFASVMGEAFKYDEYSINGGFPLLDWMAEAYDPNAPVITSQSGASYYALGKTALATPLKVTATANDVQIDYQWYIADTAAMTDAVAVEGATANELMPAVDELGTKHYVCEVTANGVTVATRPIPVTVVEAVGAPVITKQPESMNLPPYSTGNVVSVEVAEPTDGGTLSYQWFESSDGKTFQAAYGSLAKTASYTFTAPAEGVHTYYLCQITNTGGFASNSTTVSTVVADICGVWPDTKEVFKTYEMGSPYLSDVVATLYTNGDLEIVGSGDTQIYPMNTKVPWFYEMEMIRSVTMDESVKPTSMDYWFYKATSMTSFTGVIPPTISSMTLTFAKTGLVEAPLLPSSMSKTNALYLTFQYSDSLVKLPKGFAVPADQNATYVNQIFLATKGDDPLVTYCDVADYEYLSNLIDWNACNRRLVASSGNVALLDQDDYLAVTQGSEGNVISVSACTVDGSDAAIQYKWLRSASSDMAGAVEVEAPSNDGTIEVVTADLGSAYYQCSATLDGYSMTSEPIQVEVFAAATAPEISKQPENIECEVNTVEDHALAVEASAADDHELTYQWYSNTAYSYNGATSLTGATDATYEPVVAMPGVMYYFCKVTASRGTASNNASVVSDIASVTVTGEISLEISTADQLLDFAQRVNGTYVDPDTGETLPAESFAGKTVVLTADIDLANLSEGRTYEPIGSGKYITGSSKRYAFSGSFDGQGHTVSNLSFANPNSTYGTGLFGMVAPESNGSTPDYSYAAPVIQNVFVSGTIASTTWLSHYVGGLVGRYQAVKNDTRTARFLNCGTDVTINISKGYYMGGLIGETQGGVLVSGCYALGDVTGMVSNTDLTPVGGLIGHIAYGTPTEARTAVINDCYALGSVSGVYKTQGNTKPTYTYSGTLVGKVEMIDFTLTNSYSSSASDYPLVGYLSPISTGAANAMKATVANAYSLTDREPTISATTYIVNMTGGVQKKTLGQMREVGFVDALNAGRTPTVWAAAQDGANNGTPILSSELTSGYVDPEKPDEPDQNTVTITTAEELFAFAESFNADDNDDTFEGKTVILADDIDLNGEPFPMIGTQSKAFAGTFDGAGHTLSGLSIDTAANQVQLTGLFTSGVATTVVKDLVVKGSVKGGSYVGGIFGMADGVTIENVGSYVAVEGDTYVGGLIGKTNKSYVTNTVKRSFVGPVEIIATSTVSRIGGIVSYLQVNNLEVEDTYVVANLSATIGTDSGAISGIVGQRASGLVTVKNSYIAVTMSVAGVPFAGSAIVGFVKGSADISATNVSYIDSLTGLLPSGKTLAVDEDNRALSAADMKAAAFVDTLNAGREGDAAPWKADENGTANDGMPILSWQPQGEEAPAETYAIQADVTGDGTIQVAVGDEAATEAVEGADVTITATPAEGSYLAQVRWAPIEEADAADEAGDEAVEDEATEEGAEPSDEATDAVVARDYQALSPNDDGTYTLPMPASQVSVIADFVSIAWDGTLDITWYNTTDTSFDLQYAAQFEGLAAIVNGIFNAYPVNAETSRPDQAAYRQATGMVMEGEECVSSNLYGEFTATGKIWDSQNGYTLHEGIEWTNRVVGDPSFISGGSAEGLSNEDEDKEDGGNLTTSDTYYFGIDNFANKTVTISADLDFGATRSGNGWDVTSPLFMSLGGQYAMIPGNAYSVIGSSWCGTLDGMGHSFSNVYGERYIGGANYGDSQSFGIVGRLGWHDGEIRVMDYTAVPTVRQIVLESGLISARRSVGGIVGKIGKTGPLGSNGQPVGVAIVEYCINKASVDATDKKGTGGIVGSAWNNGTVRFCGNLGTITNHTTGTGFMAGGIVGSNESEVRNCYNAGTVIAGLDSHAMAIGTMNGGGKSKVYNCYWLTGSAKGGGYFVSTGAPTDNGSVEFGAGTSVPTLTADMLNDGGAGMWKMDSTGTNSVNGVPYPVLYYQDASYEPGNAFTVSVKQPAEGGTISLDREDGQYAYADTVVINNQPEPGYILDHYIVTMGDRQAVLTDGNTFSVDGDATVTAEFRVLKSAQIEIPSIDSPNYVLEVTKNGIVIDEDGIAQHLTGVPVADGDTVYEGDEIVICVTLADNAVPTNPDYYFTGKYSVRVSNGGSSYTPLNGAGSGMSVSYFVPGDQSKVVVGTPTLTEALKTWAVVADTSWFDAENPQVAYVITTPEQLAGLALLVDAGNAFEGVKFTLGNDIDLANNDGLGGTRLWNMPIGSKNYTETHTFKGDFDGNNFAVRNMSAMNDYAALFGIVEGGTIENLTVTGTSVSTTSEGAYAAGIAAIAVDETFANCTSEVSVASVGNAKAAAGIAAHVTSCTFEGCINSGTIVCAYAASDGGAAGIAAYVVANGDMDATTFANCTNTGTITGGMTAGGIVGKLAAQNDTGRQTALLYGCANTGAVTATSTGSSAYAGGIVGALDSKGSTIDRCSNTGDVKAEKASGSTSTSFTAAAGGLVGIGATNTPATGIKSSYNTGSVAADGKTEYAGGIMGYARNVVNATNSYNAGSVTGTTATAPNVGAIIGGAMSSVICDQTSTYYVNESGIAANGKNVSITSDAKKPIGVTAEELKGLASALGEAFATDLEGTNGGFPILGEQTYYTLTFADADGNVITTASIAAGTAYDAAKIAELFAASGVEVPLPDYGEGYEPAKFLGWVDNAGNDASIAFANGDVTVVAKFSEPTVIQLTITYTDANGDEQTITAPYGTTYTENGEEKVLTGNVNLQIPEDVQPAEGYEDVVWSVTEGEDGSVTFTYESVNPTKYTLTMIDGDDQTKVPFTVESEAITLDNPTKAGHTFDGWYDEDGNKVESIAAGTTGDVTVWAKWIVNEYTITFTDADGNEQTITAPYGTTYTENGEEKVLTEDVTLQIPEDVQPAEGYEDVVWSVTEGEDGSVSFAYESVNPIVYEIAYELGGGTNAAENPTTYTVEEEVALVAPQRDGYQFLGWFVDDQLVEGWQPGTTGNKTVVAQWSDKLTYEITLVDADGNEQTIMAPYGTTYTFDGETKVLTGNDRIPMSTDAQPDAGYGKVAWVVTRITDDEGNLTAIELGYQSVDPIPLTAELYSDGELFQTIDFNVESPEKALPTPTKAGHTFGGWYDEDGNKVESIATGSVSNMKLTAKWTVNYYDITYTDANGDEQTITAPYGTTYTVGDVEKVLTGNVNLQIPEGVEPDVGYNAVAWEATVGEDGAISFVAKSVDPIPYQVQLKDGDQVVKTIDFTVESGTVALPVVEKEGYDFVAWLDAESNPVTEIAAGTAGNLELAGQWAPKTFAITYVDANAGSQTIEVKYGDVYYVDGNAKTVAGDVDLGTPEGKPDAGYEGKAWVRTTNANGEFEFTARNANPITYTVTYLGMDGATNADSNPATFQVTTPETELAPATREGYVFVGWVDAAGKTVASIEQGTTGNLELTATWDRDLATARIAGIQPAYSYTGSPIEPEFTVVHDGVTLVPGVDYRVDYVGNVNVGTATVKVTSLTPSATSVETTFQVQTPKIVDPATGTTVEGLILAQLKPEGGSLELRLNEVVGAEYNDLTTRFNSLAYKLGFVADMVVVAIDAMGNETGYTKLDGALTVTIPQARVSGNVEAFCVTKNVSGSMTATPVNGTSTVQMTGTQASFQTKDLGRIALAVYDKSLLPSEPQQPTTPDNNQSGNDQNNSRPTASPTVPNYTSGGSGSGSGAASRSTSGSGASAATDGSDDLTNENGDRIEKTSSSDDAERIDENSTPLSEGSDGDSLTVNHTYEFPWIWLIIGICLLGALGLLWFFLARKRRREEEEVEQM